MLQKSILIIWLICLNLFGASLHDRDVSNVDLLHGSKATNIPYGYYIKNFQNSSIDAFENMNMTQYEDKNIFIGYGIYDVNEQNCRYLDVPSNATLPNDFKNIKTIGTSTYAVSFNRMSYTQCKSLAAQYNGFVYTPNSYSEYSSVLDAINNVSGGDAPVDLWVGYARQDCSSDYLNDEGYGQSFLKFKYKNEICNPSNTCTYSKPGLKEWYRTGNTDTHYCPIEIKSIDYLRPIQFCAPWWRVERTWKMKANDGLYVLNGRTYDFRYAKYIADYPEEMVICTDLNDSNFTTSSDQRHQYTCSSYDYIKASAACLEDITLPQCHINECEGYAENTCRKVDSIQPFKNYDIGYIKDEYGYEKKVKVKDNKIINVYDCPVPNPPSSSCLSKESVIVIPVECPNSHCAELADCMKDETISDKDQCFTQYPCEKSYGSTDSVHYTDGVADGLMGVCSDGSQVLAQIRRKSKVEKRCVAYNEYTETNSSIKKCVAESNKVNKTVDTSISETDAYEDDPRCIRINNIAEARPDIQTTFQYDTKGYFKTTIQKAYSDGTVVNKELDTNASYMLAAAAITVGEYEGTHGSNVQTSSLQSFCTATFPEQWQNSRYAVFENPSILGFVYNKSQSSTRQIGIYSSGTSAGVHSVTDSFGQNKVTDNWGVTIFDSNYKIKDYRSFNVSSNPTDANNFATFINSISNTDLIAINTYGDPVTNVNSTMKNAIDSIGGNSSYIDSLGSTGAYLLYTSKQSGIIAEKTSTSSGASYTKSYAVNVPPALAISTNAECSTNATAMGMVQFEAAYNDYNFADIGITQDDVNNQRYCFLGGSTITGDDTVTSIEGSTSDGYFNIASGLESRCADVATCLAGEVTTASPCKVHVNGSTQTSQEENPPAELETGGVYNIVSGSGTFKSDFNGYKDIFSVQEYLDGGFGYVSNYMFKLPKNNIVMLEGKEVSPIIGQEPVDHIFKYDNDVQKTAQTTKNKEPDKPGASFGGLGAIGVTIGESPYLMLATISTLVGVVLMLFAGVYHWGWYDHTYRLYEPPTVFERYVENVYGYDPRIVKDDVLIMESQYVHSGLLKEGQYHGFVSNYQKVKKEHFLNMGFEEEVVNNEMTNQTEKTPISWNDPKWYKITYKNTNTLSTRDYQKNIHKPLNTVFLGAVNSLSIVVPYAGDFDLNAYDANNNLLGSVSIKSTDFIKNTTATSGNIAHAYAKVQFATSENFNIAPGLTSEFGAGGCLASDYVEWGGGVSGIYYEDRVPDIGTQCYKSNDAYVKEHAATKITITPAGSPETFDIQLVKPLPFPNRVQLVNLLNLEHRNYECWDQLSPCNVNGEDNNATQN